MAVSQFMLSDDIVRLGTPMPKKVLILLHGLTMTGRQFMPIGRYLLGRLGDDWQIVLPTAPRQKVTWLNGQTTHAWYDLPKGGFDKNQDKTGVHQAKDTILALIDSIAEQGVHAGDIYVGGFSQGGALALLTALSHPKRLGGAVCLSGYLPIAETLENLQNREKFPIFMAHGNDDEPIPMALGQTARGMLAEQGFVVDFQTYPMGHTIDEDELNDVAKWLGRH